MTPGPAPLPGPFRPLLHSFPSSVQPAIGGCFAISHSVGWYYLVGAFSPFPQDPIGWTKELTLEEFEEFQVEVEAVRYQADYAGCGSHKIDLHLSIEVRDLRALKAQIDTILAGDK